MSCYSCYSHGTHGPTDGPTDDIDYWRELRREGFENSARSCSYLHPYIRMMVTWDLLIPLKSAWCCCWKEPASNSCPPPARLSSSGLKCPWGPSGFNSSPALSHSRCVTDYWATLASHFFCFHSSSCAGHRPIIMPLIASMCIPHCARIFGDNNFK